MTIEELKTLPFRASIFGQLTDGGHLQVKSNALHGINWIHRKENRSSPWRTYFVVGDDGSPSHMDWDQLVEAVKDMEFKGTGQPPATEKDAETVGHKLRARRIAVKKSLREIGPRIGIDPSRLSQIETGHVNAEPDELEALDFVLKGYEGAA